LPLYIHIMTKYLKMTVELLLKRQAYASDNCHRIYNCDVPLYPWGA
jgi:hypothetical protein